MYILVKKSVPIGHALNCAAHGSLMCYLQFKDEPDMQEWLNTSFKKVCCKVTDEAFEKAKQFPNHVIVTESNLENKEIAIVFCPRKEWPERFRHYELYR